MMAVSFTKSEWSCMLPQNVSKRFIFQGEIQVGIIERKDISKTRTNRSFGDSSNYVWSSEAKMSISFYSHKRKLMLMVLEEIILIIVVFSSQVTVHTIPSGISSIELPCLFSGSLPVQILAGFLGTFSLE